MSNLSHGKDHMWRYTYLQQYFLVISIQKNTPVCNKLCYTSFYNSKPTNKWQNLSIFSHNIKFIWFKMRAAFLILYFASLCVFYWIIYFFKCMFYQYHVILCYCFYHDLVYLMYCGKFLSYLGVAFGQLLGG